MVILGVKEGDLCNSAAAAVAVAEVDVAAVVVVAVAESFDQKTQLICYKC